MRPRFLRLLMLACCACTPTGPGGTSSSTTTTTTAGSGTSSSGGTPGGGSASGTTTAGSTLGTAPGIGSFCPAGPFGSPLPTATVTVLTGVTYDHFDGPVWRAASSDLLFSAWNNAPDNGYGPESAIVKYAGSFTVVSDPNQIGSNGLVLDGSGNVVACLQDQRQVARFATLDNAHRQVVAAQYNGKPFNSPNDAAIRADGTIYFTDPDYQADGRTGQGVTGVYRISPAGVVSLVDGTRNEPNGIALSLDQNWLYVGGNDNVIQRYPINADGSTGQPDTNFINAGTNVDGMGIDCAGNIYASLYAQNQIGIWAPTGGTMLGTITLAENVTNMAFGGSDHKTLYITTLTHLNTLTMPIPGLPY